MDFNVLSGHGYLLIGGLVLVGTGLLIISLIFNIRVAHSVRQEERHQEKLLEYYRNTFSQLGVILIGIGVSLFIFFFQQNYQDYRRREAELQQVLAKMALRIARGSAVVNPSTNLTNCLMRVDLTSIRKMVERTTRSACAEQNSRHKLPNCFSWSAMSTSRSSRP